MRNYSSRFRLPNGKWAYIQFKGLAGDANRHMRRIRGFWNPPDHFFHFQKGGHVAALRQHQGRAWYGKIDLSRFFNHVTRHRVTRCLKRLGYSFRDAEEFAVASTVCVDHKEWRFALPYGFVQSPLLASIAFDLSELGNCCRRLNSGNCAVSIYVDDIVISGDTKAEVEAALSEMHQAARMSNFAINTAKSRAASTALQAFNIDFDAHEMNISNERFDEMGRDVMFSGAGQVSDGILGYVRSVNPRQADQLLRNFPRAFARE
jgi:hypothetical protein